VKDPLENVQLSETRRGNLVILGLIIVALAALCIASPWVAAIILGLIVMVMLHEAGHLLAARRAGMKVTEYFLGFGPRLWSFRRGETEYGIKAIPAGGYVRIVGMTALETVPPDDEARTYRRSSTGRRLVVVLAGIVVNLLLAWMLFAIAIAGRGELVQGPTTTVQAIEAQSAAAEAGFRPGDRFVAVDGKAIDSWDDLRDAIGSRGGEETTFTVARDGRRVDVLAVPSTRAGRGFLGVAPDFAVRRVGPVAAVGEGLEEIGRTTVAFGKAMGRLVSPAGVKEYSENFTNPAEEGSRRDLERPRSLVGITDLGSDFVRGDVWALLALLGSVSLVLALVNLIPIPLFLDGGHAATVVYEAVASRVTGRTVRADPQKLMPIAVVGIGVFLMLGVSAMVLDFRDLAR
jgi:membrane-associated protease RseP (regulator of RpoE activity)